MPSLLDRQRRELDLTDGERWVIRRAEATGYRVEYFDGRITIADVPEHELEARWEEACTTLRDFRVEIMHGRVVVRPMPGIPHNRTYFRLSEELRPAVLRKGWELWPDIPLFLGLHRDRPRPDMTVVPPDPPVWMHDKIYGNAAKLVVEIVSPESGSDDHGFKPEIYAKGGVPLCLVIDEFQAVARLLSEPSAAGYASEIKITLGERLALPEPFGIMIDTGRLVT